MEEAAAATEPVAMKLGLEVAVAAIVDGIINVNNSGNLIGSRSVCRVRSGKGSDSVLNISSSRGRGSGTNLLRARCYCCLTNKAFLLNYMHAIRT